MEKQKKDKLYYKVKWTKLHSLGGKLDQVIVWEVIQTLSILQKRNKLDFFLFPAMHLR